MSAKKRWDLKILYRGYHNVTPTKQSPCFINLNWVCVPTAFGRCGIQNLCGRNIRKFVMRLRGNLASGSGGHYDRF